MTNTLQQVRELSDMEYLAKMDKELYDSLPLHEKFLRHFGEHQGMDGDYAEIDCGYEWEDEDDIPNIHEIAEWIESENKVLPSEWIAVTDSYPGIYDTCLLYLDTGEMVTGIYLKDDYGTCYFEDINREPLHGIFAWMPLPLPPSP